MTDKQERIASKIRKLLAIAEDDAASAEEIQNAMNFAQRLMASHHLTEEDLAHEPADDYAKVDEGVMKEYRCFLGGKVFYWESILATFITRFVGCNAYIDNNKRPARDSRGFAKLVNGKSYMAKSIVFYGLAEDASIAAELYEELHDLIGTMASIKWASIYKGDGASYAQGFVSGLFSQLEKAKAIEKNSSTTAMILVSRRDDLIQYKQDRALEWIKNARGKKIRKGGNGGGTKTGSYSAYAEGRDDGAATKVSATRHKKIEA